MAVELKRVRLPEIMESVLEEATSQPIIVEVRDNTYRIHAEKIRPMRYTLESLYGSLPPLGEKDVPETSNEELEAAIKDAGQEQAQHIVDELNS